MQSPEKFNREQRMFQGQTKPASHHDQRTTDPPTLSDPSTELAEEMLSGVTLATVLYHDDPRAMSQSWADTCQRVRGADRIIFDLQEVKQLNRMGVASLVRSIRRCQSRGGRVALCHVRPEPLAVLELNGVPHLAMICETPLAAAAWLTRETEPC
ncbi:MAG: STAS domain-containing protein [Planctomycetales bacterium]|nr:STAS domain-containing protein [Planctomycetales bacterium]